ncbi:MAG TPA: HD-GYP domain-containing protein [Clostridiaceae bacterium]|nr:HD-GYP domain-containing protein [Clostridiaceae bacterium]
MKKFIVDISQCKPGMQIAETIFSDYGAVIVAENTILDAHIIDKLEKLNILKVKIFDQANNIIESNSTEIFEAQYKENVEQMKEVMHDISTGKSINIEKMNEVSHSIFLKINENRDIVGCINQMRKVDEYTYTHSINVSLLCMLIGKWLRYDLSTVRLLVQTGLLHDIGKTKISSDILNKPDKLTDDEMAEVIKHPIYGYKMVEDTAEIDKKVKKGILMHHEREDGSGYPMALKSDQIDSFAKVVAIADIYDAMTSNRVYKQKESPFTVLEYLENESYGVLDTRIVRVFINSIAAYYLGDYVKLNTGEIGQIVYVNPRQVSKPIVKVGEKYVDLYKEKGLSITELI